jgi:hypothetical protein
MRDPKMLYNSRGQSLGLGNDTSWVMHPTERESESYPNVLRGAITARCVFCFRSRPRCRIHRHPPTHPYEGQIDFSPDGALIVDRCRNDGTTRNVARSTGKKPRAPNRLESSSTRLRSTKKEKTLLIRQRPHSYRSDV